MGLSKPLGFRFEAQKVCGRVQSFPGLYESDKASGIGFA
jgi:hypothetical protein